MLVVQGVADSIVPASLTMEDFYLTGSAYAKSIAHAKLYPGLGHGQVLEAGRADVADSLDVRFQGNGLQEGCVVEQIEPLTERYAQGDLFRAADAVAVYVA